MAEALFVYGTLMEEQVQMMVLGRVVPGEPDRLLDYKKYPIKLGCNVYPIVKPEPGQAVEGVVLQLTPAELQRTDQYETSAYQRKKVTLASGRPAWVYQK